MPWSSLNIFFLLDFFVVVVLVCAFLFFFSFFFIIPLLLMSAEQGGFNLLLADCENNCPGCWSDLCCTNREWEDGSGNQPPIAASLACPALRSSAHPQLEVLEGEEALAKS